MKRNVSFLPVCLLLLYAGSLAAQTYPGAAAVPAQTAFNSGILIKVLDARPWRGAKFKVQAAVRARILEPSAYACLFVRVDDEGKQLVSFDNMRNHPVRTNEWTVYTSPEIKLGPRARIILFGGETRNKGFFSFDDFHFFLQKEGGAWEEIPLPAMDFEDDSAVISRSWTYREKMYSVQWSLRDDSAWKGKHYMFADGSHSYELDNNDTAGKYANVNGIRLYYEEYGRGAPLLLLHGNRGSIADFKKQIPALARQFHVIAVDTRGQGHSTEDGKTYTYDLFADDMNALLDKLHLNKVNVLGWSDGGNTGLIMAMKYPDKVSKLAVMGANIFIDNTVVGKDIFRILNMEKKEFKGDTSQRAANALRLIHLCETEPRHRFEELEAIHCPVLVMAGEKDAIKEEHTREIAGHIAGSQLKIFSGGTHEFPEDDPAMFNAAVTDFFTSGDKK
ncbi:MAG TPA: alpha/beta hydrolase [Puia sp.]|jgi:pimeloyl-ACP methyl ester carboxylesterase